MLSKLSIACGAALVAVGLSAPAELSGVSVRAGADRIAGKYGWVASTNGGDGAKAICNENIVIGEVPANGVVGHETIMVNGVQCTGTGTMKINGNILDTFYAMDGIQRSAIAKIRDTFYASAVDTDIRNCGTVRNIDAYFFTDDMPANRDLYIKYFALDPLSLPLTSPGDTFMMTTNKVGDRIKPCWYKMDGEDTAAMATPIPDDPVCFPADATVSLEDGSTKAMSDVQIGDKVNVGSNQFSEVFMFTHKLETFVSKFVNLKTESGHMISLSPGHYIHTASGLRAASTVEIGEDLTLADGEQTKVSEKTESEQVGLYNPQTIHGDIVVNGVVASTYTTAVDPRVAHTLLAPLRAAYAVSGKAFSGLESGNGGFASLVPSGAPQCSL